MPQQSRLPELKGKLVEITRADEAQWCGPFVSDQAQMSVRAVLRAPFRHVQTILAIIAQALRRSLVCGCVLLQPPALYDPRLCSDTARSAHKDLGLNQKP